MVQRSYDPQNNFENDFNDSDLLKVPSGLKIEKIPMQGEPESMKVPAISFLPLPQHYAAAKKTPNWGSSKKQ